MEHALKILLLEDIYTDAEIIKRLVKKAKPGCDFLLVTNKNDFLKALEHFSPDVILSDNSLPQFDATEALRIVRNRSMHVPFILVTGTVSEEFAAGIIKQGADDYVLKDRMARLPAAMDTALKQRKVLTETKKAEEKIQKSKEQYRDLVENITDLICTHDLDGRILSVNRAAEELIGHKFNPEENLNIKDLLAPDRKDEFDLYITAIKTMGSVQGLMKVKTFTGNIHIWEYKNSLKTTGVDTPIVLGYGRDVTESRKAEESLRRNEARLNEAQAMSHIGSWEIDLSQNSHAWSDEFYRLYGLDKAEVDPSEDLFLSSIHPEDAAFARKKLQDAFETLKESSFDFRFIRKDGRIRQGCTEWKFEFDKKGNPLRLYGIVQDITERREAEAERKKLELKLLEQQRREQLTITATTLEAQEKERNAIGVELHDNVNQILVGTKLLLSTVKNTSDKEKSIVASCIENLQNAIDENRKIAHALVTPDLETDTLLDQITRLSHSMLKIAGLQIHIDTSSYREKFLDKERKIAIYRIAQEQCTNIVKYAKADVVNITLSTTDHVFKMSITDNGVGMKEGKKTAGIGLRNINSRLSIFNGKANIVTAPGKGFTLEIEIPV